MQDTAVLRVGDQIGWGQAANVDGVSEHLGGNGAVTAYAASRLGCRVRLSGLVGEDAAGDFALAKLRTAGVDIALVRRGQSVSTARTVALVREDGQRTFLQLRGATAELAPDDVRFDESAVDGCTLFHYGSLYNLTRLRPYAAQILSSARAAGLRTSLDLDWDPQGEWSRLLEPLCPLLDYLFVNRDEARAITGAEGADDIGRRLRRLGAKTVVLKLGSDGCRVFQSDASFAQPAPHVEATDTTGAGDVFCGAFLAAVIAGSDVREAAATAVEAAAACVQHVGAAEGLDGFQPGSEASPTPDQEVVRFPA